MIKKEYAMDEYVSTRRRYLDRLGIRDWNPPYRILDGYLWHPLPSLPYSSGNLTSVDILRCLSIEFYLRLSMIL